MRKLLSLPSLPVSLIKSTRPELLTPYMVRYYATRRTTEVGFVKLEDSDRVRAKQNIDELRARLPSKEYGLTLSVDKSKVYSLAQEDIQRTDGHAILFSGDGIEIHYGSTGIAPSSTKPPQNLLTNKIQIPPFQFGILDTAPHTPFTIEARNPDNSFAFAITDAREVLPHDENIRRYSFETISHLDEDDAKRVSLKIQNEIFFSKKKQTFFEEDTLPKYGPTPHLKSSGTLMNFAAENRGRGTTQMHYHPGSRTLLIFTTKKDAGVTLNFCGVKENPKDRKDCEVNIQFPENSYCVLTFPAFIHHRFTGDFVCISVHPKEGPNIIEAAKNEAAKSGKLQQGFLEIATVFSGEGEWQISLPPSLEKSKGR